MGGGEWNCLLFGNLVDANGMDFVIQDAVTSASNLAESLKVDLAESHKKLVAYVENTGANAAALAAFTAPPNVALPDQVCLFLSLLLIFKKWCLVFTCTHCKLMQFTNISCNGLELSSLE